MTRPGTNVFGPNLPLQETDAVCGALGIGPNDRVLEVGGAGNPFPRANVVCDLSFGSCAQRNGAPGVFRADVSYVEAPCEDLPFADGEFDFVYCTQVLEHVRDPEAACRELSRVAARGFVEVPSRLGEMINGNPTHRWIVDREKDTLVFHPRPFLEHPFANFFYGVLLGDERLRHLADVEFRNVLNHQVRFTGELACRVLPRSPKDFDYEDPEQAGRAHYSFARNALATGAPADFGYPDALEARRLLPASESARWLLAIYEAGLLRPEEALAILEHATDVRALALSSLFADMLRGRPVDPLTFPLPPEDPGAHDVAPLAEPRPRVSVVVVGSRPESVLSALESALAQDYPDVEVLLALGDDVPASFSRFRMGSRLAIVSHPKGTPLGRLLNDACLKAQGALLGFLLEGDRFQAHHLDRLVASLVGGGHRAVHGDRIFLNGAGVVGPDVIPVSPATQACSLSTVLARREWLLETGAFSEEEGSIAPLEYMVRMARAGGLVHVREATVESENSLPEGARVLDDTRALAGLRPLELLRTLMAAYTREEGLRARIRTLEAELTEKIDPLHSKERP